jgi:hypothetical protein
VSSQAPLAAGEQQGSVSAVMAIVTAAPPTPASMIGSHASPRRLKWSITAVVAGTKSNIKCCSSVWLAARRCSGPPPRSTGTANNSTMPTTEPGSGSLSHRTVTSPTSWNSHNHVNVPSIDGLLWPGS